MEHAVAAQDVTKKQWGKEATYAASSTAAGMSTRSMTRAFIAMRTGTPQRVSQGMLNCHMRATAAEPRTAITRD